jgi:hypothetical protein
MASLPNSSSARRNIAFSIAITGAKLRFFFHTGKKFHRFLQCTIVDDEKLQSTDCRQCKKVSFLHFFNKKSFILK